MRFAPATPLTRVIPGSSRVCPVRRQMSPKGLCIVRAASPSGTKFDVSRLPGDMARESWEACTALVEERTGGETSREEASGHLSRAFGWSGQSYWREKQVEVVPTEEHLRSVLDFLVGPNDLDLEPHDLASLFNKFPQVLGCDVDGCLRANMKIMEETWGIKGHALKNTVRRNPSFLGFVVDCAADGGCIGECNRCWVRF